MANETESAEHGTARRNGTNGTHAKGRKPYASSNSRDAAQNAKDTVGRAQRGAKSIVGRQVDAALTAGGNRVGKTADTVREIGDRLNESGDGAFAGDLARTLAGYVDRVATYLRDTDSDALAADVERYGRRYPIAFAGGAFAAGFALSRFVKVSSAQRLHGASYE